MLWAGRACPGKRGCKQGWRGAPGCAPGAHGASAAGRLRGGAEHQSRPRRAETSDLRCDSLCRSLLESTPSPVVFCHNDCQEGKNRCLLCEAGRACLVSDLQRV